MKSLILVTAALSGAAVMVIELSAVRLIAPWFGTSLVVWSNVIAVVLLGLALGYLFGAKASKRERPERCLFLLLGLGALLTAVIPLLAGPVANFFVPAGLSLDQAVDVFRWGSLATALCLFLVPATVLGGVGPLVTELIGRAGTLHAGDAGGQVLFSSTLGSLVGVFGTSYWAVPQLGLRLTFCMAAGLLVLAGVSLAVGVGRKMRPGSLGLALIVGAACFIDAPLTHAQMNTLELQESLYQRVRVVEDETSGMRYLQVNEASNSYQSVWQPKPGLLQGDFYYNDFVLPAWWAQPDAGYPERSWRVLCVGMGGGTSKRVMETSLPPGLSLAFEGIELDQVVVDLAKTWFGLQEGDHDLLIGGLDGRAAARLLTPGFDQIILDAYSNQIEIPAHLCTLEFFAELGELLAPEGWIQINVGGASPKAPIVAAVAGTLSRSLDCAVLACQVPGTRNIILTARPGQAPPVPTGSDWALDTMPNNIAALLVGRDVRGQWEWYSPQGPVDLILSDDLAPVEWLEVGSLSSGR